MPDSTILMDYMLVRFTDIIGNLLVYPARMRQNLNLTGGLVYSQKLLLELVQRGAPRSEAYEAVQRTAMEAWEGARPMGRESVSADSGRAGEKAPGAGGWNREGARPTGKEPVAAGSGRTGETASTEDGWVNWMAGVDFKDLVKKDPLITRYLTQAQIESCFDPKYYLRHLDAIYRRVFGAGAERGRRSVRKRK
jgi:adenylosuccinate lyase